VKIEENVVFDKDGNSITLEEWVTLFRYENYFKLVNYGEDGYKVVTKWTGVDTAPLEKSGSNSFAYSRWTPNETPLINISFVFNQDDVLLEYDKYPDSASARAGHERLCNIYCK